MVKKLGVTHKKTFTYSEKPEKEGEAFLNGYPKRKGYRWMNAV
ncbi:hypothetical protein Holit_01621 [Hollandina sp. SP2]